MESASDILYTIDDWYDGARHGAATFRGALVRYRSVYLDTAKWDPEENRFELTPISEELLDAMLEADRLWPRWEAARKAGTLPNAPHDAPRVLPEDLERYTALKAQIEADLAARTPTVLATAAFDYALDRVEWTPIAHGTWQL
jgi:hypothetical protein